jgi:hypothetical protein
MILSMNLRVIKTLLILVEKISSGKDLKPKDLKLLEAVLSKEEDCKL